MRFTRLLADSIASAGLFGSKAEMAQEQPTVW